MVNNVRFLILIVLILNLLTNLSFAESSQITVSTNNTPLDRKVLQAISDEAFSRLQLKFNLVSLPSERSLVAANNGEVDGEGLRVAGLSKQYPNLVQVEEAYTRISFVAFAKNASLKIVDWTSLKPYRVAFIKGWKMFEANASQAKVVNKVDTPEQLFKMLDSGRIDMALYTLADGELYIKKHQLKSIAALKPSLKDVDLYLYLNKKHEKTVQQLSSVLKNIKADGSYNRIVAELLQ